jgi:cysteine-rich repeat protein
VPDKAISFDAGVGVCGNGLIEVPEECDDRNTVSGDGCSSKCKVEAGYTCKRVPSQCTKAEGSPSITVQPSQTAATAAPASKDLSVQGDIVGNSNQIFVTLNTVKAFDFPNDDAMRNFMGVKFEGCPPPSVYCSQKVTPEKQLFDCLLIFPSGIPNAPFTALFSYNYQGSSGWAKVSIDPLQISSAAARNQRNSRATPSNRVA